MGQSELERLQKLVEQYKLVEGQVTAKPLKTFDDLAAETDVRFERPRWWQFWRTDDFSCEDAGAEKSCGKHKKENGEILGMALISFIVLLVAALINAKMKNLYADDLHLGSVLLFAATWILATLSSTAMVDWFDANRAWKDHAHDRAQRLSPAGRVEAITKKSREQIEAWRDETVGQYAPLTRASGEAGERLRVARELIEQFRAQQASVKGDLKSAVDEGLARAQQAADAFEAVKNRVDELIARYGAFFNDCLAPADVRKLFGRLGQLEAQVQDLTLRADAAIIATQLRVQAQVATLKETAQGVSMRVPALTALAHDDASLPERSETLTDDILTAIDACPTEPSFSAVASTPVSAS